MGQNCDNRRKWQWRARWPFFDMNWPGSSQNYNAPGILQPLTGMSKTCEHTISRSVGPLQCAPSPPPRRDPPPASSTALGGPPRSWSQPGTAPRPPQTAPVATCWPGLAWWCWAREKIWLQACDGIGFATTGWPQRMPINLPSLAAPHRQ